MTPRSYLYVPGNRPDRFASATGSGAEAVIIDLEDSVSADAKAFARSAAADYLAEAPEVPVWVRVNNTLEFFAADLDMVLQSKAAGAVIPKATPETCDACPVRVLALIETAEGVAAAAEMAGVNVVDRLCLGEVDLCAELDIVPSPDARELWAIRSSVVLASAAAGLKPPVGGVFTDLNDEAGLLRTSEQLRRQGFGGRTLIHPRQVDAVHAAFTPSPEEVEFARRVIRAHEDAGGGAAVLDGRFVDPAVVRKAQRVLDRQDPTIGRPAEQDNSPEGATNQNDAPPITG